MRITIDLPDSLQRQKLYQSAIFSLMLPKSRYLSGLNITMKSPQTQSN